MVIKAPKIKYANYLHLQLYSNKFMDNQVSKLFALTDRTVTYSMIAIPWKKIKENNKTKNKILLEVHLFRLNSYT